MSSAGSILLTAALAVAAVGGYLAFDAWRATGVVHELRFAGSAGTSAAYRLANEIAALAATADPRLRIAVSPGAGSREAADRLLAGQADLAIVQADQAVPGAMRAVAALQAEQFHLIARHGVALRGPQDLAGLTVALPPEGSGGYRLFFEVLDHYGVPSGAVQVSTGTIPENLAALAEGRVDALFTVRPAGGADMQAAIRAMSAEGRPPLIVPIAQAGAMAITRPWLRSGEIPRGTYVGQPPVPALDVATPVVDTLLVAAAAAEAEAVYRLTRMLFEERAALVLANPDAAALRQPDPAVLTALDIHPGALRYFRRDEPSFVSRYAREIEFALKAATAVASLLIAFGAWLASRRRQRLDGHVGALIALEAEARQARTPTEIDAIEDRILDCVERAIVELQSGRVSDSGFQTFALAAETVRAGVAERRRRLARAAPAAPPIPS